MRIQITGRVDGDTQDVDIDLTLRPGAVVVINGLRLSDLHRKLLEARESAMDTFDVINELLGSP